MAKITKLFFKDKSVKTAIFTIFILVIFVSCSSKKDALVKQQIEPKEPKELQIFKEAYPDILFEAKYDEQKQDWCVRIINGEQKTDLFFAQSRFLPKEDLNLKYYKLLYDYPKEIPNPADFSQEYIKEIKSLSAPENRIKSYSFPKFFYDAVYDCASQAAAQKHIVRINFLGKNISIHERIKPALLRVQKRIYEVAKTDAQVKSFVDTLLHMYGYYWRIISDSKKRSFHSVGIAIDILPKGYEHKNIYWVWQRKKDPQNWMLLPLQKRWIPPLAVINIFEEEGFIWGGKWELWDNMHFEYHPELILYRKSQF